MVTKKKSKPEPQKTAKKARPSKAPATGASCAATCQQNAKQLFSKLLSVRGNKHYTLLLCASVGFVAGVVVDHLLIKG